MPLINFSIITPTFQRCQVIRASIDSAFARATPNSEMIVADDASSDGTADMVRAAYPREIESAAGLGATHDERWSDGSEERWRPQRVRVCK